MHRIDRILDIKDGRMTTSSSGMVSGSELIGRALALEGVKNVFTIAGDHVLPALDSMADMGFRFVDTRHEQAAAHMADAWGRITGEPGVAMYTTPGFSNAIPGLANAMHSESPLLSISGSARTQRAWARRYAGNRPSGHGASGNEGRVDGYGHAADTGYDSARLAGRV